MITLIFGRQFLKCVKTIPPAQHKKLDRLLALLQKDPLHPSLHTKPLDGHLSGYYSFRITRDWRVIFRFINPRIIELAEVGHRKDIYR